MIGPHGSGGGPTTARRQPLSPRLGAGDAAAARARFLRSGRGLATRAGEFAAWDVQPHRMCYIDGGRFDDMDP